MVFQLIINGTFYNTRVVSQELIDKHGFELPQNNESKIIKNVFDEFVPANDVMEFFINCGGRDVNIIRGEKPLAFSGAYLAE